MDDMYEQPETDGLGCLECNQWVCVCPREEAILDDGVFEGELRRLQTKYSVLWEEHLKSQTKVKRLEALLKRCVPQLRKLKYYETFMTEPNDLDVFLEDYE